MVEVNLYGLEKDKVLTLEADTVVLPGLNGDIGIASGDREFSYLLKEGIIYFIKGGKVFKKVFIYSGKFLYNNNKLDVLYEYSFLELENANETTIKDKIKSTQTRIDNAEEGKFKESLTKIKAKEEYLLTIYNKQYY